MRSFLRMIERDWCCAGHDVSHKGTHASELNLYMHRAAAQDSAGTFQWLRRWDSHWFQVDTSLRTNHTRFKLDPLSSPLARGVRHSEISAGQPSNSSVDEDRTDRANP